MCTKIYEITIMKKYSDSEKFTVYKIVYLS